MGTEGARLELLGSLRLAMGEVTRFYTRSMLTQLVEVTEQFGWSGKLYLSDKVIEELLYWRKNLRKCNGHSMSKEDKVLKVLKVPAPFCLLSHYVGCCH